MHQLPTIVVVGSGQFFVSIRKGFGDVQPQYDFNWKPLTYCRSTSPARLPSSNVLFLTPTIQYGLVHLNHSFPSICLIRVWNTMTTFPTFNNFSLVPRCRSTNAFRQCCSCSKIAMLWTLASPSLRSCCKRVCSNYRSGRRSPTCIHKIRTWNSTTITASSPNASRNGVNWILVFKLVWYAHRALCSLVSQSVRFSLTIFFKMF